MDTPTYHPFHQNPFATALLDQTLSEASRAANIKKAVFPMKALFQMIFARDKE